MIAEALRARAARRLEEGASGRLLGKVSSLWEVCAQASRAVRLPPSTHVVGIGGATLGGSGKTPLVLALARALATRGARVAVAAHGYRSRAGAPRIVRPADPAPEVGDDALWLARELATIGVPVVVGRAREATLHEAASRASIVLVDGLLQTHPARLASALLCVDAKAPWGAGRCPPAGDLRSPIGALLAAADALVAVEPPEPEHGPASERARSVAGCGERSVGPHVLGDGGGIARFSVASRLSGARGADGHVAFAALAGARVGLLLAVARPGRIRASLHAHGIFPEVTRFAADHATPLPPRHARVDAWLTTAKCATKLPAAFGGVPVLALDHRLELPDGLAEVVCRVGSTPRDP